MQNTELIDQKINLKTELVKYLLNWKLFLISVFITTVFAFFHLRYKNPIYHTNTIIKIQTDKENSNTELAAFQDLGIPGGAQRSVENEIEVLKLPSSKNSFSKKYTCLPTFCII